MILILPMTCILLHGRQSNFSVNTSIAVNQLRPCRLPAFDIARTCFAARLKRVCRQCLVIITGLRALFMCFIRRVNQPHTISDMIKFHALSLLYTFARKLRCVAINRRRISKRFTAAALVTSARRAASSVSSLLGGNWFNRLFGIKQPPAN